MSVIEEITQDEAAALPNAVYYDVREQNEWDAGHIPGARFLPLSALLEDPVLFVPPANGEPVILYCQRGVRSLRAAQFLEAAGVQFTLYSLIGGYAEWSSQ